MTTMTTTLTWDFKPIALPKLNSNLLAMVGLILICTMAFTMIGPAFAYHCGPEEAALRAAAADFAIACVALAAALLTGNPLAIALAIANHGRATLAVDAAQQALTRCENEHSSAGCS